MANAVLLLSCPDQRGLVAAVSDFVYRHNGSIVHAEQHTDTAEGVFFQRVEFDLDGFDLGREEVLAAFAPVAERFGMRTELRFSDHTTPTAVFVSKQGHCFFDLLARWKMGELPMDLRVVVANHPTFADACAAFGVPFVHVPVPPGGKFDAEIAQMRLLTEHGVELVVLARYMQILSAGFVERLRNRVINIHHSFLPAFAGARPYQQAHERGVKLIGATAHYATAELDEGPIIEQEVVRVTHRDSIEDLSRKGRDLEMVVLARAVRAHVESRVLVYGNKTVVFS